MRFVMIRYAGDESNDAIAIPLFFCFCPRWLGTGQGDPIISLAGRWPPGEEALGRARHTNINFPRDSWLCWPPLPPTCPAPPFVTVCVCVNCPQCRFQGDSTGAKKTTERGGGGVVADSFKKGWWLSYWKTVRTSSGMESYDGMPKEWHIMMLREPRW